MNAILETEVAIIGAGPTGLMLANLLGQAGISALLLERREQPFTEPRAIAFDPETLRLFQTVGCLDDLSHTLLLDVPVLYQNASGKTLAHITECPPSFGHSGRGTYYQPELEQSLLKGIGRQLSVSLHRGIEVESISQREESVELEARSSTGDRQRIRASYVVDCSGGGSKVRKQMGIVFEGSTFKEKWLVIDVEGDDYEGREIRFFCDPKRPSVTLPVSKNRRRWEFLVMPGDDEDELVKESSTRALMAGYGAGGAERIERSLVYTFHARLADRFREGRVFFAGDSAHVMPPFAGQGLNSGMRDAANLSWKLVGVLQGRHAEQILDSYDLERRQHIKDMTDLTIGLGQRIMPTNRVKAWLRDVVMLTLWRFPSERRKLNEGDIIPKPSIAGSSLVHWDSSGPIGKMLVQPVITLSDGLEHPLDDLIGPSFAAIGVNCVVETELHTDDMATLEGLSARLLSISTDSSNALQGVDKAAELTAFAESTTAILIVRPDRFVIDVLLPKPDLVQLNWIIETY